MPQRRSTAVENPRKAHIEINNPMRVVVQGSSGRSASGRKIRTRFQHRQSRGMRLAIWECMHPPNHKCGGCGRMFWLPGERTQPFCIAKCGEAHHKKVRAEMVKRGLAEPPKPKPVRRLPWMGIRPGLALCRPRPRRARWRPSPRRSRLFAA